MKRSYARQHSCIIQTPSGGNDFTSSDVTWTTVGKSTIRFPDQGGLLFNNTERADNLRMEHIVLLEGEMVYPGFHVSTDMRLICNGQIYNVKGVENVQNMNRYLRLSLVNVGACCVNS